MELCEPINSKGIVLERIIKETIKKYDSVLKLIKKGELKKAWKVNQITCSFCDYFTCEVRPPTKRKPKLPSIFADPPQNKDHYMRKDCPCYMKGLCGKKGSLWNIFHEYGKNYNFDTANEKMKTCIERLKHELEAMLKNKELSNQIIKHLSYV